MIFVDGYLTQSVWVENKIYLL